MREPPITAPPTGRNGANAADDNLRRLRRNKLRFEAAIFKVRLRRGWQWRGVRRAPPLLAPATAAANAAADSYATLVSS